MCGTELDDEGARALGEMLLAADCPCPIKNLACDYFAVQSGTSQLSFSGATLSSASLTLLFGILRLNESVFSLDLTGVGVDAAAARSLETALATNTTLERLDLRGNEKLWMHAMGVDSDTAADGLIALACGLESNSSVATLMVDAMELPVKKLKGVEPATSLDLAGKKALGGMSAALIGMLVARNTAVETLDLSRNPKVARLGVAIGTALKANTSLTELNVRESALGDEGVNALVAGLLDAAEGQSALSFLDLSINGFGKASAASLASLLKRGGSKLARLNLEGNELGSEGTQMLAAALPENTTLTALSLVQNDLEAAGAEALSGALKANTTLTALYLGCNRLGNDGVGAIVNALLEAGSRTSVAQLDLHDNKIMAAGVKALLRLLSKSQSLSTLSLAGTKLEFTDTDALQSAAKGEDIGRTKAVRLWMGKDNKSWPPL